MIIFGVWSFVDILLGSLLNWNIFISFLFFFEVGGHFLNQLLILVFCDKIHSNTPTTIIKNRSVYTKIKGIGKICFDKFLCLPENWSNLANRLI